MAQPWLEFSKVTFFYDLAGTPVFEGLDLRLEVGWAGVIGRNGAGKTTLLRLATGQLTPTEGAVRSPGGVVYCPQRTDDPPEDFERFLVADDGAARSLAGRLDVRRDWPERWHRPPGQPQA